MRYRPSTGSIRSSWLVTPKYDPERAVFDSQRSYTRIRVPHRVSIKSVSGPYRSPIGDVNVRNRLLWVLYALGSAPFGTLS